MSDGAVLAAIVQMETWIADPGWIPDPSALDQWNLEFQNAMDSAEKGPGWQDLVAQAHSLGAKLEARIIPFLGLRDELKAELDAQNLGNAALRAYSAGLRDPS